MQRIERESFNSEEEYDFALWCAEAIDAGYIKQWAYEDITYPLSRKIVDFKLVEKVYKRKPNTFQQKEFTLLQPHEYTPDFRIWPEDTLFRFKHDLWLYMPQDKMFDMDWDIDDQPYVIDIKGSFQQYDGARSFSINRKWVFDKHRIYVNKVVPEKFFKATWVPKGCAFIKSGKRKRKKYENCKLLTEL